MNKNEVIEQMKDERNKFDIVLNRVSREDMEISGVDGYFSVKDILAHISAWEQLTLDWLADTEQGIEPDMPPADGWESYTHGFNRGIYTTIKQIPLDVVLDTFNSTYQALLARLESLPEDRRDPFWEAWPDREDPWDYMEEFADHYAEHGPVIQEWLEG